MEKATHGTGLEVIQKSNFGQVMFVMSSGHPKETTNKQLDVQFGVRKPELMEEIYELSAYR